VISEPPSNCTTKRAALTSVEVFVLAIDTRGKVLISQLL
jgi:hypothetical protein